MYSGQNGRFFIEYEGNNEQTVQINTLAPELLEKMVGKTNGMVLYEMRQKVISEGKESVEALAVKYGNVLDSIATSEEVRKMLQNTPLSTLGKDYVMLAALTEMAVRVRDLTMDYDETKYKRVPKGDGKYDYQADSTWVPLDNAKVYASLLKHKDVLFDNPLVLCNRDQWVFVNRMLYSPLFFNVDATKDKYDLRGTFMWNLRKSQDIAWMINYEKEEMQLGKYSAKEGVDCITNLMANDIPEISDNYVMTIVLNEYRDVIRKFEGGVKDDGMNWNAEQQTLWQKITAPYAGNVLLIDFWGMGCGPCRSGMISMRETVEALKDEPIRFLYVCDEKYSPRDAAEKWMSEMNIKGEHIFVTHEEWTMLESMFSFSGIPHAVLADKAGKVTQNGVTMYNKSVNDFKTIIEKQK